MVTSTGRCVDVMLPALLKRRARRRAERGAAVFIVVMAIVLLTGIGIFAVRTASMVDVAAGYERQATQTHHLSEFAGRTAASHASGIKDVLRMVLIDQPGGEVPVEQAVFTDRVQRDIGSAVPLFAPATDTTGGSLGPYLDSAITARSPSPEPQIIVFFSDANDHELTPGEEVGKDPPLEVTITAMGQVRPFNATPNARPWCAPPDSSRAASVQTLRSHITIVK
jgi:hypothetical protein